MNEIVFTNAEFSLLGDADLILRKRLIQEKVYHLLERTKENLEANLEPGFVAKFLTSKISRGENYDGLPYLILDFPSLFINSDALACRTMFLWGKFFSVTIHLQGIYLQQNMDQIPEIVSKVTGPNVYVSNAETPWKHTYEAKYYIPASEKNTAKALSRDYLKVSKMVPLAQYASLPQTAEEFYQPFLEKLII